MASSEVPTFIFTLMMLFVPSMDLYKVCYLGMGTVHSQIDKTSSEDLIKGLREPLLCAFGRLVTLSDLEEPTMWHWRQTLSRAVVISLDGTGSEAS